MRYWKRIFKGDEIIGNSNEGRPHIELVEDSCIFPLEVDTLLEVSLAAQGHVEHEVQVAIARLVRELRQRLKGDDCVLSDVN